MDIASLVISIVAFFAALILAGFGILLQWLVSKDTRQQATEIRKDIGDFKADASGLLGEIRGLTTQTRESQERQFDRMLGAMVERTREATTVGAADIAGRIDAIEAALQDEHPSEQVSTEIQSVRKAVETLRLQIAGALESTPPEPARIDSALVSSPVVNRGDSVAITLRCFFDLELRAQEVWVTCGVASPSGGVFGAVRHHRISRPNEVVEFVYPHDFPGADSNAAGNYLVRPDILVVPTARTLLTGNPNKRDTDFRVV